MKKFFLILTVFAFLLPLVACSKPQEEEQPQRPPAFLVLQNQLKLEKHSKKGESASFSQQDFSNLLGEDFSYITVSSLPEAEKGVLMFNGAAVMKGQPLPSSQLEYLKFVPKESCENADFVFTCDGKSFKNSELSCNIVFSEETNSPPVAKDSKLETVEGISCETILEINEPNGDDYIIKVITYPEDGFISLSADGKFVYVPEEGFSGNDTLVYSVTDRFGLESERATLSISVAENPEKLIFADMEGNPNHIFAHKMCKDDIMIYRYENGNYYFDPETPVTKMDFLVMMMCAAGLDENITAVADSVITDDGGLSSGMKGYLSAAAEAGLISTDNGKFSPKSEITFQEAAFMVSSALNLPTEVFGNTEDGSKNHAAFSAAVMAGIFSENTSPASVLTKSQTAALLCSMKEYMKNNNMNRSRDNYE